MTIKENESEYGKKIGTVVEWNILDKKIWILLGIELVSTREVWGNRVK